MNDKQALIERIDEFLERMLAPESERLLLDCKAALSPSPLSEEDVTDFRMDAYYYGFGRTGSRAIDLILSAVACAGKAFHHTQDWNDEAEPYHGGLRGEAPIDWIQNAANDAAALLRQRPAAVVEPVAWSLQWRKNRGEGTINYMTTFGTEQDARYYAERFCDGTVTVVPLYLSASPAPPQTAQVPEEKPVPAQDGFINAMMRGQYAEGWNDCRKAMLASTQPEQVNASPIPAVEAGCKHNFVGVDGCDFSKCMNCGEAQEFSVVEAEGKPSWDDAPKWAQWLAQDHNGAWDWHEDKPESFGSVWNQGGMVAEASWGDANPNWRNTLEQRPTEQGEE